MVTRQLQEGQRVGLKWVVRLNNAHEPAASIPQSISKASAALALTRRHGVPPDRCSRCWKDPRPLNCTGNLPCLRHAHTLVTMQAAAATSPLPNISHVINPLPGAATGDLQYRWTMDSIAGAVAHAAANGINVEVIAVTDCDEIFDATPWPMVKVMPALCPSRRPQFSHLNGSRYYMKSKGPLVADIISIGFAVGRGDLLVYTNYDIVLETNFYVALARKVRLSPTMPQGPSDRKREKTAGDGRLLAASLLRRDVKVPASLYADASRWSLRNFLDCDPRPCSTAFHPGHDAFAFPRSWAGCMDLAGYALGFGGWGLATLRELRRLADLHSQSVVNPLQLRGTRHLGNKRFSSEEYVGGEDYDQKVASRPSPALKVQFSKARENWSWAVDSPADPRCRAQLVRWQKWLPT